MANEAISQWSAVTQPVLTDIMMQVRAAGAPLNRQITPRILFDSPQFLPTITNLYLNDVVGLVRDPSGTPAARSAALSFLNGRLSIGQVGFNWNYRLAFARESTNLGVINNGLMGLFTSSTGSPGYDVDGQYTLLSGTAGQAHYLASAIYDVNFQQPIYFLGRIIHAATVAQSAIIRSGLANPAIAAYTGNTVTADSVFLKCNTAIDTNWQLEIFGTVDTQYDTGIPYAANTMFMLEIIFTPGVNIVAMINGVITNTIVADLPTNATTTALTIAFNSAANSGGRAYNADLSTEWT